jgi:DeoD family purine-nucleoside phosphorylase
MSRQAPIHLRPTARLAERVLLPGDPGRALAMAQSLLSDPRMFNHHRGLWGYTGVAHDGESLTIQSTGMGGPSAAIVLAELITLGARRAIRVGTCGALVPGLALGDLVVARDCICADGASRALGAGERVAADGPLTDALVRSAPSAIPGTIVSVDLFYPTAHSKPDGSAPDQDVREALAVEMEAAALFALAAGSDASAACILTVSDTFDSAGTRKRIDEGSLVSAAERMGRAAVDAFRG